MHGTIEVPSDLVRGSIPSAFEPSSSIPFLASFVVEAYECERVVGSDRVWAHPLLVWVSLAVQPDNSSWASGEFSSFVIDVITTDPALADLLALGGLPAHHGHVTQEATDLPADLRHHAWEATSDVGGYRFDWVGSTERGPAAPSMTRHFWSGTEAPFGRTDFISNDAFTTPFDGTAGVVGADPSTRLHELSKQAIHAFTGQSVAATTWHLTLQPMYFEANP